MIPTIQIRDALISFLTATALFETVIAHSDADLGAALEHLRDSPSSLAVVVPAEDKFETTFVPGTNIPVRTEVKNTFELLISARDLSMREDGAAASLNFKDAVTIALLWNDLSIPGLLCMPLLCEPLVIQFEGKQGREAWKITLEMRHEIIG